MPLLAQRLRGIVRLFMRKLSLEGYQEVRNAFQGLSISSEERRNDGKKNDDDYHYYSAAAAAEAEDDNTKKRSVVKSRRLPGYCPEASSR